MRTRSTAHRASPPPVLLTNPTESPPSPPSVEENISKRLRSSHAKPAPPPSRNRQTAVRAVKGKKVEEKVGEGKRAEVGEGKRLVLGKRKRVEDKEDVRETPKKKKNGDLGKSQESQEIQQTQQNQHAVEKFEKGKGQLSQKPDENKISAVPSPKRNDNTPTQSIQTIKLHKKDNGGVGESQESQETQQTQQNQHAVEKPDVGKGQPSQKLDENTISAVPSPKRNDNTPTRLSQTQSINPHVSRRKSAVVFQDLCPPRHPTPSPEPPDFWTPSMIRTLKISLLKEYPYLRNDDKVLRARAVLNSEHGLTLVPSQIRSKIRQLNLSVSRPPVPNDRLLDAVDFDDGWIGFKSTQLLPLEQNSYCSAKEKKVVLDWLKGITWPHRY
ncbi:hypothetical protein BC829DRAFT_444705 [Chytridium lagenaria]|nr:hypothetical protein BC829DRAFT_444705 [Chytridium lagenaria]